MTRLALASALLLAIPLQPAGASAQATGSGAFPDPAGLAFTGPWSPFALPGDLPRFPPRAPALAAGVAAEPRVGLFWTAGNPAALACEVQNARADFQLGHAAGSGEHRRPLDPSRRTDQRLAMTGWGPVEERSAMIGRVRLDRVLLEPGPTPHAVAPYGSSPFALLDTTTTDIARTGASLEGAAGWRLGRFGLGLALGYSATTGRTEAAAVPRRGHTAAPAATIGVAREWRDGALRTGVTLRWMQRTETIRINALGAGTEILVVDGFREPEPIQLIQGFFYRRIERGGVGAGAGVSGHTARWRWAAHAEAAGHRERQWSRQEDDPPRDAWDADALRAAAAAQTDGAGRLLTLRAGWTALSGTAATAATQSDSGGVSFRADESAVTAGAELRQPLGPAGWGWAARLTTAYARSHRTDPRNDVELLLETLVTGAAVHVDRRVAPRLLLSGGLAAGQHRGRGTLPHPESVGPIIDRLLYGEVVLHAAGARPWALSAAATFELRDDVRFWLASRFESRGPSDAVFQPLPQLDGSGRSRWGITVGASLGAWDGR